MDSDSLIKPKDMPAVGALYSKQFAERGYWWWKAQEISYAFRPKLQTLQILENRFGERLRNMAVFQIRRTDKAQGCSAVYGALILKHLRHFCRIREAAVALCKNLLCFVLSGHISHRRCTPPNTRHEQQHPSQHLESFP